MRVTGKTFWLPKKGNSDEEWEDAAYPLNDFDEETDEFRCAVADGATETSFASTWSAILAEGYVHGEDLEKSRQKWHERVRNKDLAWYAEEKLAKGAYAAVVGLSIKNGESGNTYSAEAVGDCCVIHTRGNEILNCFPVNNADHFTNFPALICSNPDAFVDADMKKLSHEGNWKDGDRFFLLSDAIACWALRRQGESKNVADILGSINTKNDLVALVEREREVILDGKPIMKNDDVTLIALTVTA